MHYLPLIFSVLILSQAPNLVKLSSAPSMVMVFWRLFLASLILGTMGAFKGQLPELKKLSGKQWQIIFVTTIVLFIHFYLWFTGVRKTSIANAAIIFATNPIFTAIGGHFFFHEKFTKKYAFAMIMGFIGITITFFDHLKFSPDAFFGDMLVLISAIFFSGYILLSKKVRNTVSNIPFTFILNLTTSLFALTIIFFTPDTPLFDYDLKSWLSFTLMAIFPSVMGHALFTHCLNFFNINLMSCTMLLSPILASIVSYYFYHETLSLKTVIGFVIAASGVFSMYFPYNNYLKKEIIMKSLLIYFMLLSINTYADNVDGVELGLEKNINGVVLHSGKVDSTRTYHGQISKIINANLQRTFAAVANFEDKCNDEFKSKRKFHDKNANCKYHNHNLIESVISKKTNYTGPKVPNEIERYIVTRYIYNRGNHAQNDLMIVLNYKNDKKQDVIHIQQFMLSDDESKKYLSDPVKLESAFKEARGNFIMTKIDDSKTQFDYEYVGKTDHWLLNKEMTVNEAYENVAKGINFLVESIEKDVAIK